MSDIHGRLLIGGMTLKDISGVVELRTECPCAEWCGHLLIDPTQARYLEPARPYRLELDDGCSGQIVISRIDRAAGSDRLQVFFDGQSKLIAPHFAAEPRHAHTDSQAAFSV